MALDPRIQFAAKGIRLGQVPESLIVTMYRGLRQTREDVLKTKASLPFDVEVHAYLDGQAAALGHLMSAIDAGISAATAERGSAYECDNCVEDPYCASWHTTDDDE